jgi:hypothetical protein
MAGTEPEYLRDFIKEIGGPNPELITTRRLDELGVPWAMNGSATALALAKSGIGFILNCDDGSRGGTLWCAVVTKGKGEKKRLYYADPLGALLGGFPSKELAEGYQVIPNETTFMRPDANTCGYLSLMFLGAMDAPSLPKTADKFSDLLAKTIGVRLVKSKRFNMSEEQRKIRSERMKAINAKRREKKEATTPKEPIPEPAPEPSPEHVPEKSEAEK